MVVLAPALVAQGKPKFASGSPEQQQALAQAMHENSYTLSLQDGKLSGPGMDFLAQRTEKAQFVLFGEEHFVKEFPEFLTALFTYLHAQHGFNYLALESDPVSAEAASRPPLRGNLEAIGRYAARYPNAFTFPSDQELAMFAAVGRMSSGRTDPVWGLDQSFGVLHALDRLQALPGFRPTAKFSELRAQGAKLDLTRPDEDRPDFMEKVKTSDLEELRRAMNPPAGSEAAFILDNLISSSEIYGDYESGRYYDNGFVREEQMKHLFLREYRAAQARGERTPKVLVKMGHWHVFRGSGPSYLQTLGNFVTEFATANGMEAYSLGVYLRGPWRDVVQQKGLEPIALATDAGAWTIIDFRPLRARVATGEFGKLDPTLLANIYGFDAALVLGGATAGTDALLHPPAASK